MLEVFQIFLASIGVFAALIAMIIVYLCAVCFIAYMCFICCRCTRSHHQHHAGLSASELEKLPRITGRQLVLGTECAVCLDDIQDDQPARLIPGCNHGFHLACADNWLSKQPVCPVCRAKVVPQLVTSPSPC